MKIAIIVAMSKELRLLLPMLGDAATVELPGKAVMHCGTICGNEVAVMECGIGKVNAAIGAVTLIDNFQPDLLISTGVAAGAGENVAVLDTVVATCPHSSPIHQKSWWATPVATTVSSTATFSPAPAATPVEMSRSG